MRTQTQHLTQELQKHFTVKSYTKSANANTTHDTKFTGFFTDKSLLKKCEHKHNAEHKIRKYNAGHKNPNTNTTLDTKFANNSYL